MFSYNSFFFFLFLINFSLASYAGKIVKVTDFGAAPNSFTDATTYVKKAIEHCNNKDETILLFPKGRYDFWPADAEKRDYFISNTSTEEECPSKIKRIGILFENKKKVIIEGNGSLFIFHGKMITWAFDHCVDIRLQHVEIDFERPSMSEMTIEEISDSSITALIHPDSKFAIIQDTLKWYGEGWGMHNHFAILVNAADSTLKYSSWEPFSRAKAVVAGINRVRFSGNFKNHSYQQKTVLTIRDPVRDHVGMFINLCKNVTLVDVNIHYMHGLGIISQFSENLLFESVQIVPSHGRMIAAFADCLHFSGCRGFVSIQNCHFKGSHDDPINVHGTQLRIVETLSPTVIKLRFMHGQSYGFPAYFAGDTVHFVHSASLQTYAMAIVSAAKLISEKEMMITFTKPVPNGFQKGDCLENITWTPTLTVHNCLFEATNTRGILITTPRKVIIDGNIFSKTGMQAILIADDASSWFESGPVKDVLITRNKFINCGYNLGRNNYTISIAPENHILQMNSYVHSNIRIEYNTFTISGNALLSARSTYGLSFNNNSISQQDSASDKTTGSLCKLVACDKVSILNNHFNKDQSAVEITNMMEKSIISDIKIVTNNKQ